MGGLWGRGFLVQSQVVTLCAFLTAVVDLNGRFFGGRTVKAGFYSEEKFSKLDLAP